MNVYVDLEKKSNDIYFSFPESKFEQDMGQGWGHTSKYFTLIWIVDFEIICDFNQVNKKYCSPKK